MKMDRGTNLPLFVSVNTVSSSPLSWRACASGSGLPSRVRPCSRRYLGGVSWCAYRKQGTMGAWQSSKPNQYKWYKGRKYIQLPSTISKLRTGLSDMEVKNLSSSISHQYQLSLFTKDAFIIWKWRACPRTEQLSGSLPLLVSFWLIVLPWLLILRINGCIYMRKFSVKRAV